MPELEKLARRARQQQERDEIDFLRSNPLMRVKPYGEFGDTYTVSECDSSELESVARRNTEKAIERALRNRNATTEA